MTLLRPCAFSLSQSVCLGTRERSGQLVLWNTVVRSASLLAPELLAMEVEPSPVSYLEWQVFFENLNSGPVQCISFPVTHRARCKPESDGTMYIHPKPASHRRLLNFYGSTEPRWCALSWKYFPSWSTQRHVCLSELLWVQATIPKEDWAQHCVCAILAQNLILTAAYNAWL